MTFLNRREKAQTLLADTDLPVHVIEQQLGFDGGCHMTAVFKKYVGTTPRAYRKQSRAGKTRASPNDAPQMGVRRREV